MSLNIDQAEHLARETEYAFLSTHQDINPINWGDAGGFFAEGAQWHRKVIQDGFKSLRPPKEYSEAKAEYFKAVARAIIAHLNSEFEKALKEIDQHIEDRESEEESE